MLHRKGLTLIELLVVIAIMGVLGSLIALTLLQARNAALDRGAEAYARAVFLAASAYLAENTSTAASAVVAACGSGAEYTVGSYTVPDPGSAVSSCTLTQIDATRFSVEVESSLGTVFEFQ